MREKDNKKRKEWYKNRRKGVMDKRREIRRQNKQESK
jgi:hypothetical protein